MLPSWFLNVAIVIRLSGGAGYTLAVIRGRAKPNPVTWFFWSLTPLIAFIAQLHESVGYTAWVTFALGLSPLAVLISSLICNSHLKPHFTPATITCGICAAIGVVLWRITDNPIMAIWFSIAADIFGSIPTLMKSYSAPQTEYPLTYFLSITSMVITLLTIQRWNFATYAFPAYILLINIALFSLSASRIGVRLRKPTIRAPHSKRALAKVRPSP